MRIDGIQLAQGSKISNLVVASGTSFPASPDEGELFYRSDADVRTSGLYLYTSGTWNRIASTNSLTLPNGSELPASANEGDVFYLNSNDSNEGLYVRKNGVWTNTSSATAPTFTITGDVTGTIDGGTDVLTLGTTGVTANSYGSATQAVTITVDSKGRITTASAVTITPAFSNVTDKPTTLAGYGITDAQPLDTDLTALAALGATAGLVTRTGAGTFEVRSLAASGNGISIQNETGATLNPTIVSNAVSTNTPSTIVFRDAGGDFSADVITASMVTGLTTPVNTTDAVSKQYLEQQVSSSIPAGQIGQVPFISVDGTRTTELGYTMLKGQFVESDTELTDAYTRITSNETIFSQWARFSHLASIGGTLTRTSEVSRFQFTSANLATVSASFPVGKVIQLTSSNATFTGTFTVTATSASGNQHVIFFAQPGQPDATSVSGTINLNNDQPAIPAELSSWSYDSVNDVISSTVNSDSYTGFVSQQRYADYEHEVVLRSTNSDDDTISVVLAWAVDNTGRECTLSALRSTGGNGFTWRVVYNFGRADAVTFQDRTIEVKWGNGAYGANATAAGYVANSALGGWDDFAVVGTRVKAIRTGDVITAQTSDLGETGYVPNSTITIDLTSAAYLEKFRGPREIGYGASSQASASFEVISFSDNLNTIYDVRDGDVYEYDGSSWVIQGSTNLIDEVGYGRLLFNPYTNKTFYTSFDDQGAIKIGETGSDRVRKTGDTMTGQLVVSVNNGAEALLVTQTGAGDAIRVEDSVNPDATPFVIKGDGRAIFGGTTTVTTSSGVSSALQVFTNSANIGSTFVNFGADAVGSALYFLKTRNASPNGHTAVVNNDGLGSAIFEGSDGTSFFRAANITGLVDGAVASGSVPGRIQFMTTAVGGGSPVERFRINNVGAWGLSGANFGSAGQVLVSNTVTGAPTWSSAPTLTGNNFSNIPNAALVNSSLTIGSTSVALGGTALTLAGLTSVTSTFFTGSLFLPAGLVGTPSLSFSGDSDTGIFTSAADTINITTGGVNRVTIGTGITATSSALITTEAAAFPGWNTEIYHSANHPIYAMTVAAGTTASPAAISNGRTLGAFIGRGHNGSGFVEGARVSFNATEAWGASYGSQVVISAVANGATVRSNLLTLNSTGITAGSGIPFVGALTGNASTATALAAGRTFSVSGDATGTSGSFDGSANASIPVTLVTVNSNVGSFGLADSVATLTVNAKGLVTAASNTPIQITESQITDGSLLSRNAGNETITGNWTFNNAVTGVDPTLASHLATKQYVDNISTGLDFKQSVRAATTANITLSGTQTIDGVALVAGDRVLVKNQTTASQNGIYVVAAGAWTRAADADNSPANEVTAGMYAFVEAGTANADSGWVLSTDNPITLGTTALAFSQFTGLGQVIAGAGLTKTGSTIDVGTASTARIVVNSDNIDLATVTQGAGSNFVKITLDSYGRVTGNTTVGTSDITGIAGLTTTVGTTSIALGASSTTLAGLTSVTSTSFTGALTGNASTATALETARTINGVSFDGTANITVAANTTTAATFNNGGTGAASGTTFDGSVARTISYNTVGAAGTAAANTFTAAQTLRAANALRVEAASSQDAVIVAGRAGGTGSFAATLTPTTLTANRTITLPDASGTVALASAIPTVNNGTLTLAVSGTGLSGSATFTANQSGASTFTVTSNATDANTASTIVARDASGNFSAGTITASLTGASSLNVLKTGDTMTGVLAIAPAATAPNFILTQPAAGNGAYIQLRTGATSRWIFGLSNAAESGSNVGSDFFIQRHDDAGSIINTAVTIFRNTGNVSLSSVLVMPTGSAAAPSITFGDLDTGMWGPAGNTLAFSTAGTERIRIDASGNLLVGQTATYTINGFTANQIQVAATTGASGFTTSMWSADTSASDIQFLKSRGAAVGTNGAVASGDILGQVVFAGDNGTSFRAAASVVSTSEGILGSNVLGRLSLHTSNGISNIERVRIDSNGSVGIGNFTLGGFGLRLGRALTGSTFARQVYAGGAISSDVTGGAAYFETNVDATNAVYTVPTVTHYLANQGVIGVDVTITNQAGFRAQSTLVDAVNNFGFYGEIAAVANSWNVYMVGTAQNYFAGNVGIGSGKTVPATALDVNGTVSANAYVPTSATAPTNGLYLPAANTIGISTGGTEAIRFNSVGAIGITGANFGTAGQVLTSGGSGAAPSWSSTPTLSGVTYSNIAASGVATLTTSTTTANQVVDSIPIATFRSVKYQVQITSGSVYQMTVIHVIHNGTTAFLTEYGTVSTGTNIATFDADVSGGNLRLLVTPVNAVTTIEVLRSAMNV